MYVNMQMYDSLCMWLCEGLSLYMYVTVLAKAHLCVNVTLTGMFLLYVTAKALFLCEFVFAGILLYEYYCVKACLLCNCAN